eukprot:TRINITY_DN2507_c0_g1_i1.p1 TRINITY_DN2507_c0_g1~~TRINITY_DN2507_c0_g1_i1.p1  ORF type:complete len:389 (-),score=127.78 TRINITY_DN2507_c0_g1_i1:105-1229(-)
MKAEEGDTSRELLIHAGEKKYPGTCVPGCRVACWCGWSLPFAVILVLLYGLVAFPLIVKDYAFEIRTCTPIALLALLPVPVFYFLLHGITSHMADYIGVFKFFAMGFWLTFVLVIPEGIVNILWRLILKYAGAFAPPEGTSHSGAAGTTGWYYTKYKMVAPIMPANFFDFMNAEFKSDVVAVIDILFVSFCVAALFEELYKQLLLLGVRGHKPSAAHPYTVATYAAMGALGFATLENVNYAITSLITIPHLYRPYVTIVTTILARDFITVPFHVMTGVLIGTSWAWGIRGAAERPRVAARVRALVLPILLHGTFDTVAKVFDTFVVRYSIVQLAPLAVVMAGGWVLAVWQLWRTIKRQPYLPDGLDDCTTPAKV